MNRFFQLASWKNALSNKSRSPKRRHLPRTSSGQAEILEGRRLLSATANGSEQDQPGYRIEDGVLYITGSEGNDQVQYFEQENTDAALKISVGGKTSTVRLEGVTRIVANMGGGDDLVELVALVGNSMSGPSITCVLNGDTGNDTLVGGMGNDQISGGDGDDFLDGRNGEDFVDGGSGNDLIGDWDYEYCSDTLIGGEGNDSLYGGHGDDLMLGGSGEDLLFDWMSGWDTMSGGDGDDWISSYLGYDSLDGGDGNDWLELGKMTWSDATQSYASYGQGALWGGDGNDTLCGSLGYDQLKGGNGDDVLRGGGGEDEIDGGSGSDDLTDAYPWYEETTQDEPLDEPIDENEIPFEEKSTLAVTEHLSNSDSEFTETSFESQSGILSNAEEREFASESDSNEGDSDSAEALFQVFSQPSLILEGLMA